MILDTKGSTDRNRPIFVYNIHITSFVEGSHTGSFPTIRKVPDESDRLISFAIDGASSVMLKRKRAQLIPPTPVVLLAGIFLLTTSSSSPYQL